MYYLYVLKNKRNKFLYVGYTNNLKRRIEEHRNKESSYTARMGEWELVYYEAYKARKDAMARERMLKHHGSSLGRLRKRIAESLQ